MDFQLNRIRCLKILGQKRRKNDVNATRHQTKKPAFRLIKSPNIAVNPHKITETCRNKYARWVGFNRYFWKKNYKASKFCNLTLFLHYFCLCHGWTAIGKC